MNRYEQTLDIGDINIETNISDFAGIIDAEHINKIDRIISHIEAKTDAEIAVVTLKALGKMSIDEAALKLFNKFGIGKKEENNGVLLLISTDNNQFRIEVGWGLENIINEKLKKDLIEKLMAPNFRKKNFGPAILIFTKKIAAKLKRSQFSNLSIISWLSGILSIIFTAAGLFASSMIALTTFPDIYRPGVLALLFVKTSIPAVLLALASIVYAIADLSVPNNIRENKRISRSIAGMIFAIVMLAIITAMFFLFPAVIEYIARILVLPTGNY